MILPSGFPYAELVQPVSKWDTEVVLYIPFDNPPLQGTIEFNGTGSQLREYSDGCGNKTIRKDCCSVFDPCKWEMIYYQDRTNYGNQPHLWRFTNLIRGLNADNPCSLVGSAYLRREHKPGDGVLLNSVNALTFCEVDEMLNNVCNKTRSCLSAGKGVAYDPDTGEISVGYTLGTGLIETQNEDGTWTLDTVNDQKWVQTHAQFYSSKSEFYQAVYNNSDPSEIKGNMTIDGNFHDLPDGKGYTEFTLAKTSPVRFDFDLDTVLKASRVNIGYNADSGVVWNTATRWRIVDVNYPSLTFNFANNTSNEITRAQWIDSASTHLCYIKEMAAGTHRVSLQYSASANPGTVPTMTLSTFEINTLISWN